MVRVRVKLFASAREAVGASEIALTLPDDATAQSLLAAMYAQWPNLSRFDRQLLVSANQEFVSRGDRIHDGDEIAVMPPVSGGAGTGPVERDERSARPVSGGAGTGPLDNRVYVGIQRGPTSLDVLLTRVADPLAGGIASFVGVVRGDSDGDAVAALEYELYDGMAQRSLARVARDSIDAHGALRAAVVHRHGRFEVGEPVVWIAVSAAHRGAAFRACEAIIAELKRVVPIWKKEIVADGKTVERARWIGGEE